MVNDVRKTVRATIRVAVFLVPLVWLGCNAILDNEDGNYVPDDAAADGTVEASADGGEKDAPPGDGRADADGGVDADAGADAYADADADAGGPVLLASGQAEPFSIAVAGGRIFWTNRAGDAGTGAVMAADVDGGTPVLLVADTDHPASLALDATYVYWADDTALSRAPKVGGSKTQLAIGAQPKGIAVRGADVYWANDFTFEIRSTPFPAGTPQTIWDTGQPSASAVAVDGQGLVYARIGDNANHGGIFMLNASFQDGGTKVRIDDQESPTAVVIDDAGVFWANHGTAPDLVGNVWPDAGGAANGSVHVIARSGAGANSVLADQQPFPVALAVDATNVYFTTLGTGASNGAVVRVAKNGIGVPVVLVPNQAKPGGIAVDDTAIYWTTRGDGKVWRLFK